MGFCGNQTKEASGGGGGGGGGIQPHKRLSATRAGAKLLNTI